MLKSTASSSEIRFQTNPPTRAPATPSTMLPIQPCSWLVLLIRLASQPASAPKTIHPMSPTAFLRSPRCAGDGARQRAPTVATQSACRPASMAPARAYSGLNAEAGRTPNVCAPRGYRPLCSAAPRRDRGPHLRLHRVQAIQRFGVARGPVVEVGQREPENIG